MKLVPLLVAPLVGARVVLPQVPMQLESQSEGLAPGIGVQFTTSYAIAAARYQDGTIRDLGRVSACIFLGLSGVVVVSLQETGFQTPLLDVF